MSISELTVGQAKYMSELLDKGLDTIEKTDTRLDDDELGSSTLPISTYED